MDALDAANKMYIDLQKWIVKKGYKAEDIELWDAATCLEKGHTYNSSPIAQIAWLNGPEGWAVGFLQAKNRSEVKFYYEGHKCYMEPADNNVISFMVLEEEVF
jgi:hypothetical protein